MAIGSCPQCRRRFVIEGARSYQRTCPACLHPMELHGAVSASPPAASPPGEAGIVWLGDAPLVADAMGQRVMMALADAAHQCATARALRQSARERRGEKEVPAADDETLPRDDEIPRGSDLVSERHEEPAPDPGPAGTGRFEGPVTLFERAERSCLEARFVQGRFRLLEEKRRLRIDSLALLPPLDYRLPALDPWLPPFADGAGLMEQPWPDPLDPPAAATTLYVWGYGPPTSLLCRELCEVDAAAAEFAGEAGWDVNCAGAWAQAMTVTGGLCETLLQWEPILRQDQAVSGWGVRMRRRPR